MSILSGKKILLGISGGIAAYKSAILVRLFIKSGAEVKVVMTPDAKDFITPLTLSTLSKNPVHSSFTSESVSYRFAEDLTVAHISIKGSTACLTLGSKGIALYDVSDPTGPEEKGIFPVGYSYTSIFWGDKLLVCTREGIQIITIEQ